MLLKGSLKPESFLTRINRYVTGGEGRDVPKLNRHDHVAYLGAGYWRAALWVGPSERLTEEPIEDVWGVTLINPDRTYDEIQAVELGIAILASLEYRVPGRKS